MLLAVHQDDLIWWTYTVWRERKEADRFLEVAE